MKSKILNDFKELFQAALPQLEPGAPKAMNALRKECFDRFVELGGVPVHSEEYRYLNLLPQYAEGYNIVLKCIMPETPIKELFHCAVHGLVSFPVIAVNGWYHPQNSVENLPDGVVCCGMRQAAEQYPELFEKYYGKAALQAEKDSTVWLNGAMAQDGVFIYIPKNVELQAPIQIINLLQANSPLMSYQRNLIVMESGAQATILACDHTLVHEKFLHNSVTECMVADNANLDYIQIQSQNSSATLINTICTEQQSVSNVQSIMLSLYGGTIRNNQYLKLAGQGAHCDLYGCYLLGGEQCTDNYTRIDHAVPRCTSNEIFKGVMDGNSVGNFTGSIIVRPDARKTEAYQANNNILLADTARINTKPQLIIDNDDVKCSHGATVGQIDEEAMFYLRSRGIGADEARMIMMAAFAHDIVRRVKLEPLRNKVATMVEKRLRGEKVGCESCKIACNK